MSENAKAVALDVIRAVRNGQIVRKGKIAMKNGYCKVSADSSKPYKTKTYKKIMQPLVEQLVRERQRALDELSNKDLSAEKYSDLVKGIDTLTKIIQLLGGRPTEINKIDLSDLSDEELTKLTEESDEGIGEEGISKEES